MKSYVDERIFRVLDVRGREVGLWPVSAFDDDGFFERLKAEHSAITNTIVSCEDEGLEI